MTINVSNCVFVYFQQAKRVCIHTESVIGQIPQEADEREKYLVIPSNQHPPMDGTSGQISKNIL